MCEYVCECECASTCSSMCSSMRAIMHTSMYICETYVCVLYIYILASFIFLASFIWIFFSRQHKLLQQNSFVIYMYNVCVTCMWQCVIYLAPMYIRLGTT